MALRITDCKATVSSITIFYSDAVDQIEAKKPSNYTIWCPLGDRIALTKDVKIDYDALRKAAFISLSAQRLPTGAWLSVAVSRAVKSVSGDEFKEGTGDNTFATKVNGGDGAVTDIEHAIEDAVSYPVLTEEIGYPPSPLARTAGAPAGMPAAAPLGQAVTKALSDVLGWQLKDDPKAFIGALNASFSLKDVDGHTEATWTPRTYAVQTDLSGGITGAQASVYARAKDALDQSLPLLDGLYPLFKEAKDEDVTALRATVRSQFTDLVNELSMLGGPRVSRVSQLFFLLLGQQLPTKAGDVPNFIATLPGLITDPDFIGGSLGNLRVEFGFSTKDDLVNTIEDEQNVTNFRIISDYVTSLAQSWLNNLQFFGLTTTTPFFGTQLVLLSRQLSVVSEAVNEVRFTLDSVFIGPAERQTLPIVFPSGDPPMFLEDLLSWIDSFASEEGPRLIQDGGKFAVGESFVPIGTQLQRLVQGALHPTNIRQLPNGYRTVRVQRSLRQLSDQLQQLVSLATPLQHIITPEPEPALSILGVNPNALFLSAVPAGTKSISLAIIGTGFDVSPKTAPGVTASPFLTINDAGVLSDNLISATLDLDQHLQPGSYTLQITVTNRGGAKATLQTGFAVMP